MPYIDIVVELVEQPELFLLSDLVGRAETLARLRFGMPMRVTFPATEGGGPILPQFTPTGEV